MTPSTYGMLRYLLPVTKKNTAFQKSLYLNVALPEITHSLQETQQFLSRLKYYRVFSQEMIS